MTLIPCTAALNQPFTVATVCNPGQPVTFDLPIRFQQITDPVPARFSLNTDFHLMRKRDLWLSERKDEIITVEDASFAPGKCINFFECENQITHIGKACANKKQNIPR